jgi:hypothetical protein
MPAYVISEVEVLDEAVAARHRDLASASILRHGGRYLARGADAGAAPSTSPTTSATHDGPRRSSRSSATTWPTAVTWSTATPRALRPVRARA